MCGFWCMGRGFLWSGFENFENFSLVMSTL